MVCSDFGAQGNKNRHRFHIFLFYLPWSDGTGCMILIFFNVEFQISLFTFCFNLLKSLFSFSSLSAIRVVLSAYLRLLMPYPLFPFSLAWSSTAHSFVCYSRPVLTHLYIFLHLCLCVICSFVWRNKRLFEPET